VISVFCQTQLDQLREVPYFFNASASSLESSGSWLNDTRSKAYSRTSDNPSVPQKITFEDRHLLPVRLQRLRSWQITIPNSFKPRPMIIAVLPLSCTDSILMTKQTFYGHKRSLPGVKAAANPNARQRTSGGDRLRVCAHHRRRPILAVPSLPQCAALT
jgi:hypothetical protein